MENDENDNESLLQADSSRTSDREILPQQEVGEQEQIPLPEKSWFYYLFNPILEEATDLLEKALAKNLSQ